jgi:hypothetical protein
VRSVALGGLAAPDLERLVADTVRKSPAEVGELACRLSEKTSGNPFFVGEFLRTLNEEKLLRFAPEARSFTWDLERIDALSITPNVVELMLRRLKRLPPATLACAWPRPRASASTSRCWRPRPASPRPWRAPGSRRRSANALWSRSTRTTRSA